MSETTQADPVIGQAIEKINKGASLQEIAAIVAPKAPSLPAPKEVPLAPQITKKQKESLERLPEVFGSVVPTERRALEPTEVTLLLAERDVLDSIEKMAEERKGAIRTIVLNHNDIAAEADENIDLTEVARDKDGHYIVKGEILGDEDAEQRFTVTARKGSTTMSAEALKALALDENEPWFTHEDFLAMTEQVRVFSEAKALLLLKKRPDLVEAIRRATSTGQGSVAVAPKKA